MQARLGLEWGSSTLNPLRNSALGVAHLLSSPTSPRRWLPHPSLHLRRVGMTGFPHHEDLGVLRTRWLVSTQSGAFVYVRSSRLAVSSLRRSEGAPFKPDFGLSGAVP